MGGRHCTSSTRSSWASICGELAVEQTEVMKAIVHAGTVGMDGVSLQDIELREPGPDEVRVRLKTAGLNHRDLFVPNWRQPVEVDMPPFGVLL